MQKNNHFPIDFAIFTKALRTDGRMDGRTDGRTDGQTDGWTNGWTMFLSYTDAIDASDYDDLPTEFAFFTKALRTDGRMDQRTNRRTDIPSYRDAIAASKNNLYKRIIKKAISCSLPNRG